MDKNREDSNTSGREMLQKFFVIIVLKNIIIKKLYKNVYSKKGTTKRKAPVALFAD